MYNIIKTDKENVSGNFKKIVCTDCHTVFVFNQEEVVLHSRPDVTTYSVECPVCGEMLEIRADELVDSDFYGKEI